MIGPALLSQKKLEFQFAARTHEASILINTVRTAFYFTISSLIFVLSHGREFYTGFAISSGAGFLLLASIVARIAVSELKKDACDNAALKINSFVLNKLQYMNIALVAVDLFFAYHGIRSLKPLI